MKVYGLLRDNGDGSSSLNWFKEEDKEYAESLIDESSPNWNDAYNINEGSFAEELTFPDDLDIMKCGFTFKENPESKKNNKIKY